MRRHLDLAALAFTFWSILLQGHRFGVGNNEIILASIRHLNDAAWLAGDWILGTPPMHPATTVPLAFLCRYLREADAFLLVQIATRFVLLAGTWRLMLALEPRAPAGAAVAAMLFVVLEPRLRFGSHYLQGSTWESAHLGMAMAVLFLALAVRWMAFDDRDAEQEPERRRWRLALWAGVAGGAATVAHLFIALPLVGVAAATAGIYRRGWREVMVFLVPALVIGGPAWVPAALDFFRPEAASIGAREMIALLQWRHPHHQLPWTWPGFDLFTGIFLLFALQSVCLGRRGAWTLPMMVLTFYIMAGLAFTACALAQAIPAMTLAQPLRMFSLMLVLLACAWAPGVVDLWRRGGPERVLGWVMLGSFRAFPPLFALIGMRWGAPTPMPETRPVLWPAFLSLAVSGGIFIATLQFVDAPRALVNSLRRDHWLVATEPTDPARLELTRWVRDSTPTSAVFCIPISMPAFRVWEERAVVLDMKAFPYRATDLAEWRRRYEAIAGTRTLLGHEEVTMPMAPLTGDLAAGYYVARRGGVVEDLIVRALLADAGVVDVRPPFALRHLSRDYVVFAPVAAASESAMPAAR